MKVYVVREIYGKILGVCKTKKSAYDFEQRYYTWWDEHGEGDYLEEWDEDDIVTEEWEVE